MYVDTVYPKIYDRDHLNLEHNHLPIYLMGLLTGWQLTITATET